MSLEMQLNAQIARNALVLAANGVTLTARRVHVLWHPRGWQVATVKHDVVEILPTVHADAHDANRAAADLAGRSGATLHLHNDAGGDMAAYFLEQAAYEFEQYCSHTAWMN